MNRTRALAFVAISVAAPLSAQTDPASEPTVVAVGKVLPAVVNVNTERVVRRQVRDPYEDFYAKFFGDYGQSRPREVRQTLQSLGSGFFVNGGGYIVTNQHVVERAADLKIEVITNDGKTWQARYITGDPKKDLAMIKVDGDGNFPFIDLNNPSPNLLGETVIVVGNAVGYGSSISRGVLSATKRSITIDDIDYKDLLQTDAAINPGNSGGPVIDVAGRLVGVSSAKMAFTPQGVPTQGLGFAIPATTVRDTVAEFMKIAQNKPAKQPAPSGPAVSRANQMFGMELQDLTPDLTQALGLLAGRGVLISGAETDSPAADAGLERGFVVYRVGRRDVNSVKEIEAILARLPKGGNATMTVGLVRSDGSRQLATVALAPR